MQNDSCWFRIKYESTLTYLTNRIWYVNMVYSNSRELEINKEYIKADFLCCEYSPKYLQAYSIEIDPISLMRQLRVLSITPITFIEWLRKINQRRDAAGPLARRLQPPDDATHYM